MDPCRLQPIPFLIDGRDGLTWDPDRHPWNNRNLDRLLCLRQPLLQLLAIVAIVSHEMATASLRLMCQVSVSVSCVTVSSVRGACV